MGRFYQVNGVGALSVQNSDGEQLVLDHRFKVQLARTMEYQGKGKSSTKKEEV